MKNSTETKAGHRKRGRLYQFGCVALLSALSAGDGRAEGIPEPSLILYGAIRQVGTDVRLTTGTLSWVLQPAHGGPAVTVSAALQNINDQFSYVLRVPCETSVAGLPISSNSLPLSATAVIYDRSQVRVDGERAYFVQPALTNFTVHTTSRGQFHEIDLVLHSVGQDFAAWALQHFGSADVSPDADADGDGVSNVAEFKAGTDPRDANSQFAFIDIRPEPAGGMRVSWASVPGKSYTIQRSTDLLNGFVDLKVGEPGAASRTNTYHDVSATGAGPYFYRLRVH